jgi:hypothetical protein
MSNVVEVGKFSSKFNIKSTSIVWKESHKLATNEFTINWYMLASLKRCTKTIWCSISHKKEKIILNQEKLLV